MYKYEKSLIDISLREFAKNIVKLKNVKKFQALECFKGIAINNLLTSEHWQIWSKLWTKKKETNFKQSRRMAGWLKLITNELPTGEILHKRRPDLYNQQTKCQWCKEVEETLDHLITCKINLNRKEWKLYLEKKFCKWKEHYNWNQQKAIKFKDKIWSALDDSE